MSLEQVFAKAAQENRAAFIPYCNGGFPDEDACLELILALDRAGADIIEVGIPFSDPLADGPVIQTASTRALASGVTPAKVLALCARASGQISTPLVVMTYVNPVLAMGYARFAQEAAAAGVAGVLVPDLPPEEGRDWIAAAQAHGLEPVFMAAPTTPTERVKAICGQGKGFLYYVSMTGVTGTDLVVDQDTRDNLARVAEASSLPVAVGFGIARPEQAQALAPLAQGVVVGSALVRLMLEAEKPEEGVKQAEDLARSIRAALGKE